MENVALRLDLGFLSLMSDSPVKIFGNEIAREIHDMNCELVETALRLQKKIAQIQTYSCRPRKTVEH